MNVSSKPSYCDDIDPYDLEFHPECQDCQNQLTTVGPLLSTVWGQGVGYNDLVPNLGCVTPSNGRVFTGCVATAMA